MLYVCMFVSSVSLGLYICIETVVSKYCRILNYNEDILNHLGCINAMIMLWFTGIV